MLSKDHMASLVEAARAVKQDGDYQQTGLLRSRVVSVDSQIGKDLDVLLQTQKRRIFQTSLFISNIHNYSLHKGKISQPVGSRDLDARYIQTNLISLFLNHLLNS